MSANTQAVQPAVLSASDITVRFMTGRGRRRNEFLAVDHVSLEIARGEIVGLVGESGSGKSTFSRVICGLQREYSGSVVVNGQALTADRTRSQWQQVQMIFQDPYASLDPRMTVAQTIAELLRFHGLAPRKELRARTAELIDLVQLPQKFLDLTPVSMSGGQRQRVAIARALALQPELVVADEAVAALDVSVQAGILDLFARLSNELGLSILFISHDLAVVQSLCRSTAVIQHGVLVDAAPTSQLFAAPTSQYTRELIAAVPRFSSQYLDALP